MDQKGWKGFLDGGPREWGRGDSNPPSPLGYPAARPRIRCPISWWPVGAEREPPAASPAHPAGSPAAAPRCSAAGLKPDADEQGVDIVDWLVEESAAQVPGADVMGIQAGRRADDIDDEHRLAVEHGADAERVIGGDGVLNLRAGAAVLKDS